MVPRVCKLLIKDPNHPNKVYHQWATTISPGTKPETFRGDLLPETDSTVNYKLSVDPEDPEDPVEYYSPEQVLAFALEYLASGSDGPACPLPCASWDAEKQRLTLTIVRESKQDPIKKPKKSNAKEPITRVRTPDSALFMEAVRRFYPFAKRGPGEGPRLLNTRLAANGELKKYWQDKMAAAYAWSLKRGITLSREDFQADWTKKATDFNTKRTTYEKTTAAARAVKDKNQPKNERGWYKNAWRSQWGKMWDGYKRDPVRFTAGEKQTLTEEEVGLCKELESLLPSRASASVKDAKVSYGAIDAGGLLGPLAKALSGLSSKTKRSSLGSTGAVDVAAAPQPSPPMPPPMPQSSPGAIDKLAAAGAERVKALGDKKRTDAKKRKDERTAEAPAKKHKGDEVVAPAAKAKTDAKTAAEGKAAKVPAAKAGKAARGKAARGK
ncbi:hypothetical protein CHLRE_14g622200v5 [Chlamydomonas reinhardtii]|uniref:Uncharacterized protein n=2 Tax=Chlamydomonas reinhardtii TaxID=3055 RepID=A0A2K3CY20_CHLRE|nr:uncharacterized protein CHLRE_14g622200v5 [Chlamydomonas reinhardtii]PNW73187.1 hypothetical protein CHLRE_14g622200v5 [Chlamydomonas reinhardtii]